MLVDTPTNRERSEEATSSLLALLAQSCRRGYYGSVTLTVDIKDGTIATIHEETHRTLKHGKE